MDILNKTDKTHSTLWHIAIVVLPVLLIGVLFTTTNRYISVPWEPTETLSPNTNSKISVQRDCIDRTLTTLKLQNTNFDQYERVWSLCGNEAFNTLYLHDFKIRREKFIRQELDERVTLAMVVAITISGVVMSGLQLLMSYRLALSGHTVFDRDIELSIQKDRIALKSSMVGLAILVISLAFFVVYVKWIYTITEVPTDAPQHIQATSGHQLPVTGTLNLQQKSPEATPHSPP